MQCDSGIQVNSLKCKTYEERIGELLGSAASERDSNVPTPPLFPALLSVPPVTRFNDSQSLYSQASQTATASKFSTRSVFTDEKSLSGFTDASSSVQDMTTSVGITYGPLVDILDDDWQNLAPWRDSDSDSDSGKNDRLERPR